jgi:DNA-directed RNA polymerase specialized sigma24 family protein
MIEPFTIGELRGIFDELERYRGNAPRRRRTLSALQSGTFDMVARELALVSRGPSGRRTLELLTSLEFAHTGLRDLRAIAERVQVGSEGERSGFEMDGLVRLAKLDPNAVLMTIVALRPALERIVVFARPRRDNEDVVPELIAQLCEQLHGPPKPVPAILGELKASLRSSVRHEATIAARNIDIDDVSEPVDPAPGPDEVTRDLLAWMVGEGVISEDDAKVVAWSVVGGESLHSLADELQIPYRTIQSRRLRAIAAMRQHLESDTSGWER